MTVDKEALVALLFDCQNGKASCRYTADRIIEMFEPQAQAYPLCEAHQRWPCNKCGTKHFPDCQCFYCR